MKKSHSFRKNQSTTRSHSGKPRSSKSRRPNFERLEDRWLLSAVGFNAISNVTLPAGTTMFIPLNSSDAGHTVNYAVTASDYSKLTPSLMPSTNKTLQLNVTINGASQAMDFQLFDNLAPKTTAEIEQLVNSGFYNGLEIYRNAKDGSTPFVVQGGNDPPTGAIKTDQATMAEEFNPDLQYTSAGILAMARTGVASTSSSEFFVTEEATRFLDFNYTMFGFQTVGSDVVKTISEMTNGTSSTSTDTGYLATPVTITSASIFTDTQNGVLELRAPSGVTGTVTVTVTASDGTNTPTTQTFTVTIAADTPPSGETYVANPFAAATPAAPTSVAFLPGTGTSSQSTNLNNSASGKALQFQVSGVTSGNLVEVLADGNVIGHATATGTTVVVTTDGSTKLTDGAHTFTAIQVAQSKTVTVTESDSSNTTTGTTAESATADVPSLDSAAVSLAVDTVAPTVAAVSSTRTAGAYGAGASIPITVTFSEPVTVTGTPQLTLNASSGAVATYTGGSGTSTLTFTYTVAVGDISADLDYTSTTALTLNGGAIQDTAGNAATLTLPTTGTDGLAAQDIVIATIVTGVSSTQATGAYGTGIAIPITVTFSEPVTVTGTPQLTLNASRGAVATYTGGSGTSTLTFTYTVAAGDNIADLDYASTTALALNGGAIQNATGNAAVLTLPTTGADGLAIKNIAVDTAAPTVAGVSSPQTTAAYGVGIAIPITVTFSEPVTVTGTPQLTLNASSGAVATYTIGSGTSTLTFTYTVAAGDSSSDLDYTSTTALALNGGAIKDAAGNVATLTLPATGADGLAAKNITINTVGPAVASVSSTQATGTYGKGTTISIAVTFNKAVTVTGTPQLALNAGSNVLATYTSGSGTSTLTFTYTVALGDNSSDLDYASITALTLNGGAIQDAEGNAGVLSLPTTGADGLATQHIAIVTTPTISVVDAGGTYNGSAFSATATVTGVSGTAASSLDGVTPTLLYYTGSDTTGTSSTTAPTNAGTYTVVASFAGSANYAAVKSQATFTIAKASLTITADNKIHAKGASLPTLTFTTTGLVADDSLTTQPTLSTTATTSSSVGVYTIAISGATASSNYTVTMVNGALTVVIDDTIGGYDSTTSLFLLRDSNATGMATNTLLYGVPNVGFIPLVGDWDGNGTETIGLYYPATSDFYLRNSNSSGMADTVICFGAAGCGFTPIVGDWDGNGTDTVGLYDPTHSVFYLKNSNTSGMADMMVVYGPANFAGLTPIVGNWAGSGADTVGLYNTATSVFYLRNSNTTGYADKTFTYSPNGAGTPIAGDWNGSGQDTVGLYYSTSSTFYLSNSNAAGSTSTSFTYGPAPSTGWTPLAGHWSGDGQAMVTAVSSTQAPGTYGTGAVIPITVTFSEPVTVTGTPQLAMNGGTDLVLNYASGSGTSTLTFTYTVAAGQNIADLDYASTTALALNGGAIKDATGNAATLTLPTTGADGLATLHIVIDTTAPTVAGVSSTQAAGTYGTGTAIPITVTFSDAVTVTGTPQLTLNAGGDAVARYASGSGTSTLTFTYTVATGDTSSDLDYASTAALALNGGAIKDAAGNAATLTLPTIGADGLATKDIIIDGIAPAVTAVSSSQAAGTYVAGTTIPITVTFSKPVTVTGTPQLSLNAGTGAVATYTSGSGTSTLTFTYTVAAGQNSSDLDYASTTALALNSGAIKDAEGNAAVLTLPTTGADGLATENIVIDATAPTVTAVSSTQAAGTYGTGTAIPITVTFSEAVTVTGTPQLSLNAGSGVVATYASGSGTSTLTFTYTVAAGDTSSDLDYASTTALALNNGTIQDAAGNVATLTLPTTGTDGLATQSIVIDATAPAVTAVSSTQATGTYGTGTAISITVTFSKPVTVTGTPQLSLNAGTGAVASYTTGSGTSTLTFTYTVATGDASSDLDYASTTALGLNGGTIKDALGNAATLTLPTIGADGLAAKNITIDTQTVSTSSVQQQAAVDAAFGQGEDWLSA
jgi:cyclophilin family peptidyl-prolyl cis-trans isomerase